jgi:transglutaminase-like putative cysteine protease
VDGGIVAALVGLALAPLGPVFVGVGCSWAPFLRPAGGGLILGAAGAALGAWRRWQPLETVAVLTGAYLVLGPALAAPELAFGGLLPTWPAERWLVTGATAVWQRLLTAPAPVGWGGGFGLAPFVLAYVGAAAAVSVALRAKCGRGAWAALAPLATAAAAVALGTAKPVAAVPFGLVTGLGSVAWAASKRQTLALRRPLAMALTVAVAVAGGIGAGALVGHRHRLVVREQVQAPFDPRDHPSPLSSYRRYLKADRKAEVMLEVGGLPLGGVVKLAVMDRFDGIVWNVTGGGRGEASGNFTRMPQGVIGSPSADVATDPVGGPAGETHSVELTSHDLETVWLYSIGEPVGLAFAGAQAEAMASAVRLAPASGALVLAPSAAATAQTRTGLSGQTAALDAITYTLETVWRPYRPADAVIAAAEAGTAVLPAGVTVPAADLAAAAATAGAATAGARALALERFLQDGYYSDGQIGPGQGTGRIEVLAGHGADRVAELVTADVMVGDAEQYASAMAVMARSLGLPARVVMGFAPGYGEQAQAGAGTVGFAGPASGGAGTGGGGTRGAETRDAGTLDAETPGAETRDAETPDAGTPDAGTPDAETRGAGTRNAGATRDGWTEDGGTATGDWSFTGSDMTAWVEIDLAGLGWVGFFPTPNRQDSPQRAPVTPDAEPQPQMAQPPPAQARPSDPPAEDVTPVPVGSARPVAPPPVNTAWGPRLRVGVGLAGVVALLASAIGLAGWAKARRWRRRERSGRPVDRVVAGWTELIDRLRELRVLRPTPVSATRMETAAGAPAQVRALVARLAREADGAAFGARMAPGRSARAYWRDVALAERAAKQGLSRSRRLMARIGWPKPFNRPAWRGVKPDRPRHQPGPTANRGCPRGRALAR